MAQVFHRTKLGKYYLGDTNKLLDGELGKKLRKKVQLILTSPPFPLNNKKSYGNLQGKEYKEWFIGLSEVFSELLTPNGSIVIELGNAWEPKRPIQSLLPLESLLGFVQNRRAGLHLCQEFVCYNPSRLPSPVEWVNIKRIRVTDSFTHVWWMSKNDYPKADNSRVLRPYSSSMKMLLKRQSYNAGKRPSEHAIGEKSFLKKHKGSIMHNLIELEQIDEQRELRLPKNVFSISHTQSNDFFLARCRKKSIAPHPARMPIELASFFIEMLTEPGDIVLDPFGGSNTTGFCAEKSQRKWISIDTNSDYAQQSVIRFQNPLLTHNKL